MTEIRALVRHRFRGISAALKEEGMQVTELSPEEQEKLREKVAPVIEKHAESVGTEMVEAIQAELDELRK